MRQKTFYRLHGALIASAAIMSVQSAGVLAADSHWLTNSSLPLPELDASTLARNMHAKKAEAAKPVVKAAVKVPSATVVGEQRPGTAAAQTQSQLETSSGWLDEALPARPLMMPLKPAVKAAAAPHTSPPLPIGAAPKAAAPVQVGAAPNVVAPLPTGTAPPMVAPAAAAAPPISDALTDEDAEVTMHTVLPDGNGGHLAVDAAGEATTQAAQEPEKPKEKKFRWRR